MQSAGHSHVGHKTCIETTKHSKDPVVFSHSNVYGLVSDVGNRNTRDDEIKACNEKGGVIGLTTAALYLSYNPVNEVTMNTTTPTIVKLASVDSVGIGLDVLAGHFYIRRDSPNGRVRFLRGTRSSDTS